MNIVEAMKKLIAEYPKMADFSGGLSIDYTDDTPNNFGLSPVGDDLLKEDLLGNQTRQHNFVLYAVNQSYTDYDRLANSTFLLEFGYWLGSKRDIPITAMMGDIEKQGMITNITTANGMLFSIPTGNPNDGVTYQIQIQVIYKIESEEN